MAKKLSKGDRVEFTYKGKVLYGIVTRGGSKNVTVTLDGGEESIKGGVAHFTVSNHPIPTDEPNMMDKWSIESYKEIEGHGDSPTFSAKICLHGNPVMSARNSGWGGPNEYHTLQGVDRAVEQKFYEDVRAWMALFDNKATYDIGDLWIEWYQYYRPYGVTAAKYIGDFNEKLASFKK